MGSIGQTIALEHIGEGHFGLTLTHTDRAIFSASHPNIVLHISVPGYNIIDPYIYEVLFFNSGVSISVIDSIATLIAFVVGVLLVTCAIFSTPWVKFVSRRDRK